jgi:hypothetical protein
MGSILIEMGTEKTFVSTLRVLVELARLSLHHSAPERLKYVYGKETRIFPDPSLIISKRAPEAILPEPTVTLTGSTIILPVATPELATLVPVD